MFEVTWDVLVIMLCGLATREQSGSVCRLISTWVRIICKKIYQKSSVARLQFNVHLIYVHKHIKIVTYIPCQNYLISNRSDCPYELGGLNNMAYIASLDQEHRCTVLVKSLHLTLQDTCLANLRWSGYSEIDGWLTEPILFRWVTFIARIFGSSGKCRPIWIFFGGYLL